jgi:hypothetical protein
VAHANLAARADLDAASRCTLTMKPAERRRKQRGHDGLYVDVSDLRASLSSEGRVRRSRGVRAETVANGVHQSGIV